MSKIDGRVAVKNVLMSVSDKTGLETFVPALVKACPGVKIYSTGGTYTKVKEILGADADKTLVAVILFLVLASDIFLPVPSSIASTACGLVLGPVLGFAVSFLAMSASAASGYALGRFASGTAARIVGASDMAALREFQRRAGPWTLLALRPVPVLSEVSAVFAGIGRIPVVPTALQLVLGNAVVSLVYVLVGAFFADAERGSWLAFLAAMAVSGVFFLIRSRMVRPEE